MQVGALIFPFCMWVVIISCISILSSYSLKYISYIVIKNIFKINNMAKWINLTKHLQKNQYSSFSNSFKNWRRDSTAKLILQRQHYPNSKARHGRYKKKKKEKRKKCRPLFLVNIDAKFPTKTRMEEWLNMCKSIGVIHHIIK